MERRFVLALSIVALSANDALAAEPEPVRASGQALRAEIEAEYLWPTSEDRRIHTVSIHGLVGRGFFGASWIGWRAGLTASYAWGHILQLDDQFRDVRSDNAALALGPMLLLRLQTPELFGFSFGGDGSGGILLHSREFPAGGDIYNFMWRAGLLLERRLAEQIWLGASFHVMHVSNGQGLGPHNPSYEGQGAGLWLSAALD